MNIKPIIDTTLEDVPFVPFDKIGRLSRTCTITEKIDGTNAQIYIGEDGTFKTGSRNRWITPEDDNYGFSRWAHENKEELMRLGPGRHFGEWWGYKIQHGYGGLIKDKRLYLFNTSKWSGVETRPACCGVVPILYEGEFSTDAVNLTIEKLRTWGSAACPGYMKPEGIIVYHHALNIYAKKTLIKDESPKGILK